MVNNLKIMEMLKEAGVRSRLASKHDLKKKLRITKTYHFKFDHEDSKNEPSDVGSLFNSSYLIDSYSSNEVTSKKSDKTLKVQDSSSNNDISEKEESK